MRTVKLAAWLPLMAVGLVLVHVQGLAGGREIISVSPRNIAGSGGARLTISGKGAYTNNPRSCVSPAYYCSIR